MIYCPEKYIKKFPNLNEEFLNLKGELDDREAKITLARFLRHNLGFTVELISGIKLAGYQEMTLKAFFNRDFSMCVWGRGCSKCETYNIDTYILTKKHGIISLVNFLPNLDFSQGEKWLDFPEQEIWNGREWVSVSKVLLQPKVKGKKIITSRGYSLGGSVNHLIQTWNKDKCIVEWKKYSDIKEGDYACINRNDNIPINTILSEEDKNESYLIGLILGDGCMRNKCITSADEQILRFIESYPSGKRTKDIRSKAIDIRLETKFFKQLIYKYNLKEVKSYYKEIPQEILKNRYKLKECLSGLFDTDGHISSKQMVVGYCSTSERMARQVHISLLTFGIVSTLKEYKTKSTFGKCWKLQISGGDCIKFHNNIGFRLDRKRIILESHINSGRKLNTNKDIIPGLKEYCQNEIKSKNRLTKELSYEWRNNIRRKNGQKHLSYNSLNKYMDFFKKSGIKSLVLENLQKIYNENFYFDKIEKIEEINEDCIDFNVPNGERYWSNGFISHNSFISAIYCFLQCIFEPKTKIVIAGPTFRTARNIFSELEKLAESKAGILLQQAFGCKPSRRADVFEWKINSGEIRAIPLNGEKIRGFRASVLLLDEYLLLSEHMVENVLTPFLVANKDITEKMKIIEAEDELVKLGAITESERTVFSNTTKLICLSSASYTFENLYVKYKEWRDIIYDPKSSPSDAKYFISQLGYQAIPSFMINQKIIEQAQNGGSSDASFQREYCAQFTDGSESYFSAKKMKECTIQDGIEPTLLLSGKKGKKYILAIDPSFSNAPTSDFFAMAIVELDMEKPGTSLLVHNYAVAGGDLKDHIKYFYYIMTHFNIELIIIDNAGYQFIDSATESELFKKANIKLSFFDFDSDKEGLDYQLMIQQGRKDYNKLSGTICFKQIFTSEYLRKANEHLQACIDHKRVWFASKISSIDEIFEANLNKSIDADMIGCKAATLPESMEMFISTQDNLIHQVKSQCALIEVKSSAKGNQTFDLPQHLKRDTSKNRARKDNYTALMLATWAVKSYYDMMDFKEIHTMSGFLPFIAY